VRRNGVDNNFMRGWNRILKDSGLVGVVTHRKGSLEAMKYKSPADEPFCPGMRDPTPAFYTSVS